MHCLKRICQLSHYYSHETIQMQSSAVLSQPRNKKHESHSINCRSNCNTSFMNHHFCRKLSQASASSQLQMTLDKSLWLHSWSLLPRSFPAGAVWAGGVTWWGVLPPRDWVSSLCPLHAEGPTPEAASSKQLQNVNSESSETTNANLKELNSKNPL